MRTRQSLYFLIERDGDHGSKKVGLIVARFASPSQGKPAAMGAKATYRNTLIWGLGSLLMIAALAGVFLTSLMSEINSFGSPMAKTKPTRSKAAKSENGDTQKSAKRPVYEKSMIQDRIEWTYLDKKTVDVTLINDVEGADLKATATSCLKAQLPGHQFAQCYVFASQEEYDFKNMTTSSRELLPAESKDDVGVVNICWTILGRQEPGRPANIANMHDAPQTWQAQGCPGW